MKILVIIKQTFDTEAQIQLQDGRIQGEGVKKILNPYDEYAVEEAVQLKEKNGGEVIALGIGDAEFDGTLRHVLAMGCDRAVVLDDPALLSADARGQAAALAAAIRPLEPELLLCGYTMIDCGDGEVNIRLAELLGLGQVMAVSRLELEDGQVTAASEQEGGRLVASGRLPLLIGVDKGINEPRYPGMKSIMQGRKKAKAARHLSLADLGLSQEELQPVCRIQETFLPARRSAGTVLTGEAPEMARRLAELLHGEAKVI